ncbi:MAG TPA: hypothetical protein VFE31_06295, partial [Opitutaceae bacterium]|nr:hypothetical protein [Opitutaceae bacterium]
MNCLLLLPVAAALVLGGCCNQSQPALLRPVTQGKVGMVMVTPAPPIPWSQISQSFAPGFTNGGDLMLAKAFQVTATSVVSNSNSTGAGLTLSTTPAAAPTPATTVVTTNSAVNSPGSTNAGTTQTNGTVTTTTTPASSAPAAPSPTSAPALTISAPSAPSATPVDAGIAYPVAMALQQEVAVLNQYFSGLTTDWGNGKMTPYVVTFHVEVLPSYRNLPYDTYIDLSVIAQGERPRVKVKVAYPEPPVPVTPENVGAYAAQVEQYAQACADAIRQVNQLEKAEDTAPAPGFEAFQMTMSNMLRTRAPVASTQTELYKAVSSFRQAANGSRQALDDANRKLADVQALTQGLLEPEQEVGPTGPVEVLPLLATDSVESLQGSFTNQNALSLALSLQAAISFLPVSANVSNIQQSLAQLIGRQYNSTLMVGRTGRNTVRIRIGALLTAVGTAPTYTTGAMGHDISLIVLVPAGTTSLSVCTSRMFQDTGEHEANPPQETAGEAVRALIDEYNQSVGFDPNPSHQRKDGATAGDGYSQSLANSAAAVDGFITRNYEDIEKNFADGDYSGFYDLVRKDVANRAWLDVIDASSPHRYDRLFATRLWTAVAATRNLSGYTTTTVELGGNSPDRIAPILPLATPPGTFLAIANGHLNAA